MIKFREDEKRSDEKRSDGPHSSTGTDQGQSGSDVMDDQRTCLGNEEQTKERITIIDNLPHSIHVRDDTTVCSSDSNSKKKRPHLLRRLTQSALFQWLHEQFKNNNNRYAFQMAVAFTLSAIFVVVDPIANVFHSPFWMGVAVVAVLDNTIGGFLTLGIQRIMGTIIGGVASIVIMTIVRSIFRNNWDWRPTLLLCVLMFIQIFFIAKIKLIPNYSYAGSIGMLTTVIILLAGYHDIIHDEISYAATLGAWRVCNMVIGVLVAMLASFCVFPVRASGIMRTNLGKSMEKAADLYQHSAEYYLDFTQGGSHGSLASILERRMSLRMQASEHDQPTIKETLQRIFSNTPATTDNSHDQDEITRISNEAIRVLSQLQTESTRLRNVSNEYNVQVCFNLLGGKDRRKRYMRRAKRYNESIEAMKRIVWPLASFRLLLPLVQQTDEEVHSLRARMTPTRETLECFADSLTIMRKLGEILKDHQRPLSDFGEDWAEIHRMVAVGHIHAQRELKETVKIGIHRDNMDGYKLIAYYGFLVRCSMIWEGLKTVVDKLSPLNGTLSRASSCRSGSTGTPLPSRDVIHAPE
ncbi:hypothetical protein G6F57_002173 [Rhizopus arrhizus]|nr:hypothetical protein G6F24_010498 [Rhizopus arrhizus]KAG1427111.1 hypothetical protein G6F58_001183 [Rhizopus delemar]KAG0779715.1 hypothetical protein G6F22_010483 [Rhizopus arrhizus]KAG0780876.1 hypothetical protein G6F21_011929 [Rhizopus arrhizus]KAG0805196.1 hypothetical protein G6F20_012105 [Rhizopus arrhizus]